jgi:simple sugar transport system permease protein
MTDSARAWLRSSLVSTALFAGAVALALAASGVFTSMYDGSVNGWGSLGYTLDNAAPLLIVALGAIISVRAGQFNIGQEGQLMMGALAGALVAIRVHGPGPLILILTLCAAAAGGAAWAGIAALLRYWRGVDIVISSLLLIFVAAQLLGYAVNNEWFIQEHGSTTGKLAESEPLSAHVRLPHLGRYPHPNAGAGFLLAMALALIVSAVLARSRWGFRLRILGLNPVAARRAGINAALIGGAAIVLSGAFAGLAGGVVLTSTAYRLTPTISNNIGWSGLLVALVARNNPGAAVATALLFGAAEAGGSFLSTAGIATDLVPIVQALVVLGVVLPPALLQLRARRRSTPAVAVT